MERRQRIIKGDELYELADFMSMFADSSRLKILAELLEAPLCVNHICKLYGTKNVLLVSIHNNAAGSQGRWLRARGWSIYTTKGITQADRLAQEIYDVAKEEFKSPLTVRTYTNKKLGVDYEENFYILLHTYCPAVLVENFFQDNKEDVKYLKSDAGKGSCTHVICQGVENYINKYM